MPTAPRKPLLVNLVWCIALLMVPVTYVLAYAPIYLLTFGPDPTGTPIADRQRWQSAFLPVECLIDHTPIAPLIVRWSAMWGVGESVQLDSELREFIRLAQSLEEASQTRP